MNSSMPRHLQPRQPNQRGIISILMTMVMVIVISLIVLGLAQMSRREQRQTADSQLSAQAFYAAESGVNDAAAILAANPGAHKRTACNDYTNPYNSLTSSQSVDSADPSTAAYTCVLISSAVSTLNGTLPGPLVWPLQLASGALGSVTLQWAPPAGGSTSNANCPVGSDVTSGVAFTANADWSCPYGVLRVDLVAPQPALFSRDSLITSTKTAFIVPTNSSGSVSQSFAGFTGPLSAKYSASCPAFSGPCEQLTVTNLTLLGAYYIRITSLYQGGQVAISPSGLGAEFVGAQAVIDSTGKAQDVLRRIKVAVNLNSSNQNGVAQAPLISGGSVCKRYIIFDSGSPQTDYGDLGGCD